VRHDALPWPQVLRLVLDHEDVVDKPYKSLVGSLLYPSQWCWPDLSYSVGALSQVMAGASKKQWDMGLCDSLDIESILH
jgi:hypothetical protein